MSDERSYFKCMITLLAAAVIGTTPAAAAQETPSRVALATPQVACHAAPSHTANVAEVLEHTGNAWAVEIWVRRTATDERGETWIHFEPGLTSWVAEGCWVPESMVVSTERAGHLLELADHLLSAEVLPPLEHLLAVHTLFVHSRYREQVEESPVFSRRRADLMARAVEAAQRTGQSFRRPVDRDPRIVMWIESFGDRVRYSESPPGWGTWTVEEGTPGSGAERAEPGRAQPAEGAPAPGGRELAVIAPDVACRVRPSRTAAGQPAFARPTTLRLDLHFRTDRPDTTVAGDAWVFYPPGDCWVAAAHTAPGDTDEHVLAMADRFLTSGEGWSTFNHISLLAVLSVPGRGHRDAVEESAVLGLRRLELLRRVLGEYWTRNADAVTLAWIEALGYEIAYTGEGSAWTVSDEAYLTLYERHRSDAFAEEILWTFASETEGPSCEGTATCFVEEQSTRGWPGTGPTFRTGATSPRPSKWREPCWAAPWSSAPPRARPVRIRGRRECGDRRAGMTGARKSCGRCLRRWRR